MAFKIAQKIKAEHILNRDIDQKAIKTIHSTVQKNLLDKTSPEVPTDYYFCRDFSGGEHLFVFGTATPSHKKIYKETAKGKHGFAPKGVSSGSCFIIKEGDKSILCLRQNKAASSAGKGPTLNAFKKFIKKRMGLISGVRWVEGAIVTDAATGKATATDTDSTGKKDKAKESSSAEAKTEKPPEVTEAEINDRVNQLKEGLKKLKTDVIIRYKKGEASKQDAAFVQALRKAASTFLIKITQTDAKAAKQHTAFARKIKKQLPQWKDLETRLLNAKPKAEIKAKLKGVVKEMGVKRNKIKDLLKRVNLKAM